MLRFICLLLKILLCIVQGLLGFLWSLIKRREEPNFTCDIALITGGAQGLGRELALLFSSAGATVVIWDINEEKLRQTVSEITARGREAFGYVVDLSNREEVKRGAERVREEVGNVSILINNVGVLPGKLLKKFKDGEFEKTITVNFLSHYWVSHHKVT